MQSDTTDRARNGRRTLRNAVRAIPLDVIGLFALLAALIAAPLGLLVAMSFNAGDASAVPPTEFGLGAFVEAAEHVDWIRNSLLLATGGTVLSVALGVVLSWILYRTTVPGRRTFEVLIAVPYPMGPLIAAFAWSALAAPQGGLINELWRASTASQDPLVNGYSVPFMVLVMAIVEAPVAVLTIGAAIRRMDPSLEESSAILGASKISTAMKVTMPLMAPAILSAALFIFASMLGAFAIPAILGSQSRFYVVTTGIYSLFNQFPPNYPVAAALGIIIVGITAGAVWLVTRFLRRAGSYAVIGSRGYRSSLIDAKGWAPFLLAFEVGYVAVALVLPVGVIIASSFQPTGTLSLDSWSLTGWTLENYEYVLFEFPPTQSAIQNSLILGVGTGLVAVPIVTLVAWVVHRSRSRGKSLLEQTVMVPQAVPRLILAVGLLWAFLWLPLKLYGTLTAVLVGYVIVFLPLAYRAMSGAVVQVDSSLEEAAAVIGAGWTRIMRTVTLPLLAPALFAAWLLLFMTSVREVATSIFLTSSGTRVLGPAIYNFWASGGLGSVSALVIVQVVIIAAALVLVQRLGRRASEL